MKVRVAAALGIGAISLLAMAPAASAATFLLKDTGAGKTDVLNTTGELTGGDASVIASITKTVIVKGKKVTQVTKGVLVPFVDMAAFQVKPGELLTSYSITNLPTKLIGEISGGTAEIFKVVGGKDVAIPQSIVDIQKVPLGVITPQSDFSDQFKLGPGDYVLQVASNGLDAVSTQGLAKYSVELQGVAVPEPATWGVMLMGFGAIGAALRSRRQAAALA